MNNFWVYPQCYPTFWINMFTSDFEKIYSCMLRPLRGTRLMLSAVFMLNSNSMRKQNIESKNFALALIILFSCNELSIGPFDVTDPFLYLLKISENRRFTHFFWRYRKRSVKCVEKNLLLVIYVIRFILLWFAILLSQNWNFWRKREVHKKE